MLADERLEQVFAPLMFAWSSSISFSRRLRVAKADDRRVVTVRYAILCPPSGACPFPNHTQSDKEAKLTARYFCDQKEHVSLCVCVRCIKGARAMVLVCAHACAG